MSRLDEIAGQGPVAWINKRGDHVDISSDCTVYGSHTIPLYPTDPAPLVALIRQLGELLPYVSVQGYELEQKYLRVLAALAEFDKGEG